jgi:hypothetical protein
MTTPNSASVRTALLGFVLALLIQFAAIAYWGGSLKQQVEDIDRRTERIERVLYPPRASN